jgi:hypothetical protein
MKLLTIDNIKKKDLAIQYRREYQGTAVFTSNFQEKTEKIVSFTLEHSPVGDPEVKVSVVEDLDYPLLPVIIQLKEYIKELDREGKLL